MLNFQDWFTTERPQPHNVLVALKVTDKANAILLKANEQATEWKKVAKCTHDWQVIAGLWYCPKCSYIDVP